MIWHSAAVAHSPGKNCPPHALFLVGDGPYAEAPLWCYLMMTLLHAGGCDLGHRYSGKATIGWSGDQPHQDSDLFSHCREDFLDQAFLIGGQKA